VAICGGHREVLSRTQVTDSSSLIPEVYVEIYLDRSFKQLVDETLTEAWECYPGFMIDLLTASMEDCKFNQGFYCGLSQ
jgi:hypothetical protein